jgi:xylulose-5-phosphate/fructose-6-phosphate phosphoketolase
MVTATPNLESISAFGPARATVQGAPLSPEELHNMHAYWRACCYLILGMLYLRSNPLLREPLQIEHIKRRLLGHWGSSPGQSFIWTHLNRVIRKYDLNMIYVSGPGHGAPGVLAPIYLDGSYSEIYPDKSQDAEGMKKFFRQFSFPGGIGSHCTPETPGSIHEGGELGYSLSHSFGTVFDNSDLITEGFWRAHQIPIEDVAKNPKHLQLLEQWMRSYRPEELFDEKGHPIPPLRELSPRGNRRMGSNPHANGGLFRLTLRLPDFRDHRVEISKPGQMEVSNTSSLGVFLREVMRQNADIFRVFGPDETTSNKLDAIYQATKKIWLEEYFPEDLDGGELGPDGRVMEMLSEHTLEGWLEGYLLSGRHGLFATYESFVHVIDSMVNQHAKWLEKSNELPWREPIPSLNLLITSTVWRQDHNGFTHQDPGFLDIVANKSPAITRIYLPPDVNTLLSVADHCLRSKNYINVIVCDKQLHLQYLNMEAAIMHCTKGIGLWDWASNDQGTEPDVVIATAGDIPTQEGLAATALLRNEFSDLKIRFINVVDLFRLQPDADHPHGLSDRDFDSLFTLDKPIIFNFHAYPWMIHRLTYRRHNHDNLHVRGYQEKGSIDTPFELAIRNGIDRFSIAIEAIDRVPSLQVVGAHAKDHFKNEQIACRNYAYEYGTDKPEIVDWKWPY